MKTKLILFFLCLMLAGRAFAQGAGPFYWDLMLVSRSDGDVMFPYNGRISLGDQDVLTITVTPQDACFCYIIWRGEGERLSILHDGQVQAGTGVSVETPQGSGSRNCYIIIGRQRQERLEGLIRSHRENTSLTQQSRAVYNEVQNIQRAVNGPGEPVVQFGSIPGAGVRGSQTSASSTPAGITRYSGQDRYVRIISVR